MPVVMAHDEGGALDHAHAVKLGLGLTLDFGRLGLAVRTGFVFNQGVEEIPIFFDGLDGCRLTSASTQLLECGIDGYPMQPGLEYGAPVKRGQVPPGIDQGLLHGIFGQRRITRDASAEAIERTRVCVDQAPERDGIAIPGSCYPVFIRIVHRRLDDDAMALVSKAGSGDRRDAVRRPWKAACAPGLPGRDSRVTQ
jgi:hypothetical protein